MNRLPDVDEVAERITKAVTEKRTRVDQEESKQPTLKGDTPVAYYESDSRHYYVQNSREEWIRFTESSLRRLLKQTIYRRVTKNEGVDTMMDDHFVSLQTKLDVSAAMPLAGYMTGLHPINGERILVTKSARYIRARAGDCSTIRRLIETLLPSQEIYVYGWLKAGFRSLKNGPPFQPGQLLAIAGPPGCGKSLFQNLVTEMFGGRVAKPYQFMTGKTNFNSELFYAEHLAIEDEAATTNIQDRRTFSAKIKNMLVNEMQMCYRKGRESLTLSPFWRMTCTLNDEPESLMVLPPIDADVADKIILLKADYADLPFGDDDPAGRSAFRSQLSSEIPAFLSFLSSWRIADRMKDKRYGIKAWQQPDLLECVAQLSPEHTLLTLIDTLSPWNADQEPFNGTANELQEILLNKDKFGRVLNLLKWPQALGIWLSRLTKTQPGRVTIEKRKGNMAIWKINPPPKEPTNEEGDSHE